MLSFILGLIFDRIFGTLLGLIPGLKLGPLLSFILGLIFRELPGLKLGRILHSRILAKGLGPMLSKLMVKYTWSIAW